LTIQNDHWFSRNCDPEDSGEQQEAVQSGGGGTGAPGGGASPNTLVGVVEQLLGQCYGDSGTLLQKNFPTDPELPLPPPVHIPWDPLLSQIVGLGLGAPLTPDILFVPPTADDEDSGKVCTSPPGTTNASPITVECDNDKNLELQDCIQNHLDCFFRPFVGGAWKPPQADCDSFVPKATYGTTNMVCIRNCVTERAPVFEMRKGMGTPGTAIFNGANTVTVTGN
jgi:hypothetical protein